MSRRAIFMEYFKKANEYYSVHDYKRAIAIYNKALKFKEYEISSMHNIALCYIKLEQYKRAIPLLKIASEKNPTGTYYFNLAYAYYMARNYKKALLCFNTAWALSPENENCRIMIDHLLKNAADLSSGI
jgi:tetratricopeptide (TPR) repeat protein